MKLKLNNVLRDIDKKDRKRKRAINRTIKGKETLLIGHKGVRFVTCPKSEAVEYPHTLKKDTYISFGGYGMKKSDIAIDNTGIVAKKLNEFRKQRKAINTKEQKFLEKYYKIGKRLE